MIKLSIIFIFFTTCIFAQKIEIGNSKNQLSVYKYVLKNFDSIKKNNPEEIIFVTINFNKNQLIKNISYYSCTIKNMHDEIKKETTVSYELNNFIENSFSFLSDNIFFSKKIIESSYSFYIPLIKKNLEDAIIEGTKELEKLENKYDKTGIISNCKFDLQINNLYFNKRKYEDQIIKSKLNLLNSELIEIAPNLYFIFRILKTNEFNTNLAVDYFEYKIMYLNGTLSELFVYNRFEIFDTKNIEISEIESFGGNDILADSTYCESEEVETLSQRFYGFKFNLKLRFQK